jgi:hypothetical protein
MGNINKHLANYLCGNFDPLDDPAFYRYVIGNHDIGFHEFTGLEAALEEAVRLCTSHYKTRFVHDGYGVYDPKTMVGTGLYTTWPERVE